MKFWKFEFPGDVELQSCIQERRLPRRDLSFAGLKDTYSHPFDSMVVGDAVFVGTLVNDEAKFFAIGKVRARLSATGEPTIDWVLNRFTKLPEPSGGLPNWQTKTSFEISSAPAKRYGLPELVNYYIKGDA